MLRSSSRPSVTCSWIARQHNADLGVTLASGASPEQVGPDVCAGQVDLEVVGESRHECSIRRCCVIRLGATHASGGNGYHNGEEEEA